MRFSGYRERYRDESDGLFFVIRIMGVTVGKKAQEKTMKTVEKLDKCRAIINYDDPLGIMTE